MGVEISNLSSEVPNSLWLLRKSSLTKTQTKSNVSVVAVNKCNGSWCFDERDVSLKKVKKCLRAIIRPVKKSRPFYHFRPPIFQLRALFIFVVHFSSTCTFYNNPNTHLPKSNTRTHHFHNYHPKNYHTN